MKVRMTASSFLLAIAARIYTRALGDHLNLIDSFHREARSDLQFFEKPFFIDTSVDSGLHLEQTLYEAIGR